MAEVFQQEGRAAARRPVLSEASGRIRSVVLTPAADFLVRWPF